MVARPILFERHRHEAECLFAWSPSRQKRRLHRVGAAYRTPPHDGRRTRRSSRAPSASLRVEIGILHARQSIGGFFCKLPFDRGSKGSAGATARCPRRRALETPAHPTQTAQSARLLPAARFSQQLPAGSKRCLHRGGDRLLVELNCDPPGDWRGWIRRDLEQTACDQGVLRREARSPSQLRFS